MDRFKTEFFNELLDNLCTEIGSRFNQIRSISSDFNFLWGNNLDTFTKQQQQKCVQDLVSSYPEDFDGAAMVSEIHFLKDCLGPFLQPDQEISQLKPMDVLNTIHKNGLESSFPNIDIALRIFLTLPVTVATNERSFSKLKLIKNYLRSSMGQDRLSHLAILSIEHEMSNSIPFDELINDFALKKSRKIKI